MHKRGQSRSTQVGDEISQLEGYTQYEVLSSSVFLIHKISKVAMLSRTVPMGKKHQVRVLVIAVDVLRCVP